MFYFVSNWPAVQVKQGPTKVTLFKVIGAQ